MKNNRDNLLNISTEQLEKKLFMRKFIYDLRFRQLGLYIGIILLVLAIVFLPKNNTSKIIEFAIAVGIITMFVTKSENATK